MLFYIVCPCSVAASLALGYCILYVKLKFCIIGVLVLKNEFKSKYDADLLQV